MIKLKFEFHNPKERFLGNVIGVCNFLLYFLLGFFSQIIQHLTFNTCIISVCEFKKPTYKEYYLFGTAAAYGSLLLCVMSGFCALLLWGLL